MRLRALVTAAVMLAGCLVAPGVAAAVAPSYYIDPTPRAGGAMAIVGDSLTVADWKGLAGNLQDQGFGPFQMEARSGRRTLVSNSLSTSGIEAVRHIRRSGFDPVLWVVALGTNDLNITAVRNGETDATINGLLDEIGPGHRVVWINTYAVDSALHVVSFNERLAAVAMQRPEMTIADWFTEATAHPEWTGSDGVHPTLTGAKARNEFVAAAAMAGRGEVPLGTLGDGVPFGPCDGAPLPTTVGPSGALSVDVVWAVDPVCVHTPVTGVLDTDPFSGGAGTEQHAMVPVRVLEARVGDDGWLGVPAPYQSMRLGLVGTPPGAIALQYRITVSHGHDGNAVAAWPCPGTKIAMCVTASASMRVDVDLVAWWSVMTG